MLLKIAEFQRDKSKIKEVMQAIETIPIISMNFNLSPFTENNSEIKKTDEESNKIQEGCEAILTLNLKKENKGPLQVKIQATSKIKDASWWVVVGNEYEDKLLILKKIYFKNTLKRELQI
jgi:hypothetical protein